MKTRTFDISFGLILPIVICIILLIGITQVFPIKVQYDFPERNDEIAIDSALSIAVNTISWNRACPQQVGIYLVDYDSDYDPDFPWSVWLMDSVDTPNDGYPMFFKTLDEVKAHIKLCLFYDLTEGI